MRRHDAERGTREYEGVRTVVYRSRVATRPAEPGTSGRRWRQIGVPY